MMKEGDKCVMVSFDRWDDGGWHRRISKVQVMGFPSLDEMEIKTCWELERGLSYDWKLFKKHGRYWWLEYPEKEDRMYIVKRLHHYPILLMYRRWWKIKTWWQEWKGYL